MTAWRTAASVTGRHTHAGFAPGFFGGVWARVTMVALPTMVSRSRARMGCSILWPLVTCGVPAASAAWSWKTVTSARTESFGPLGVGRWRSKEWASSRMATALMLYFGLNQPPPWTGMSTKLRATVFVLLCSVPTRAVTGDYLMQRAGMSPTFEYTQKPQGADVQTQIPTTSTTIIVIAARRSTRGSRGFTRQPPSAPYRAPSRPP